jgi:hypothetical protein
MMVIFGTPLSRRGTETGEQGVLAEKFSDNSKTDAVITDHRGTYASNFWY